MDRPVVHCWHYQLENEPHNEGIYQLSQPSPPQRGNTALMACTLLMYYYYCICNQNYCTNM